MFNPFKWLWKQWHGEDAVPATPKELVEKWPILNIKYHFASAEPSEDGRAINLRYNLEITEVKPELPAANEQEDEFADLCKLPIEADSLL